MSKPSPRLTFPQSHWIKTPAEFDLLLRADKVCLRYRADRLRLRKRSDAPATRLFGLQEDRRCGGP